MIFQWLLCFWSFVVDLVVVRRMGDSEKEIEIMLLRQQLRIVERRQQRGPVLAHSEKLPLVALTARLQAGTTHWRERPSVTMLLFKLDTVLKSSLGTFPDFMRYSNITADLNLSDY